jgi:hypothetical protein
VKGLLLKLWTNIIEQRVILGRSYVKQFCFFSFSMENSLDFHTYYARLKVFRAYLEELKLNAKL